MQFTVTVGTPCSGGNHIPLTITVGGQSKTIIVTSEEFAVDFTDFEQIRSIILDLIRSRCKEDGATTNAQRKTAIESRPFYI